METSLSNQKISFLALIYLILIPTFPFRIGMYTAQILLILIITFAVLLYLFLKPQIAKLIAIKNPQIDVFIILKEAPQALIQGENHYSISYTQSYPVVTPDYFSYWPGAFLLTISSLFFLFFHLINRIAFTNHYYFVGNLLVFGILAFFQEDKK